VPRAVFVKHDAEHYAATELARGPWDLDAQHGGAPAALLARAFEQAAAGEELQFARLSYEFLRPVPLGVLRVEAAITRPGRRVQLLEGSIFSDDTEVVRAHALRVHPASAPVAPPADSLPPPPSEGRSNDYPSEGQTVFATDAMEIRFVAGKFMARGKATAWFRLRVQLIEGAEPTALERLAAAADFGNGISSVLPWDEYLFINPDLTVYLERPPAGEWICLESSTRIGSGGVGLAESVLYDERGRIGRATQALLVAAR